MEAMVLNVKVSARHVGTKANGKADALSRLDMKRFRKLGPKMDLHPSAIPDEIWPLNKVWLKSIHKSISMKTARQACKF